MAGVDGTSREAHEPRTVPGRLRVRRTIDARFPTSRVQRLSVQLGRAPARREPPKPRCRDFNVGDHHRPVQVRALQRRLPADAATVKGLRPPPTSRNSFNLAVAVTLELPAQTGRPPAHAAKAFGDAAAPADLEPSELGRTVKGQTLASTGYLVRLRNSRQPPHHNSEHHPRRLFATDQARRPWQPPAPLAPSSAQLRASARQTRAQRNRRRRVVSDMITTPHGRPAARLATR